MEIKCFSKIFWIRFEWNDWFRETKQASEMLYKLLNGLSQPKIRMTSQQQLFCQQVVERVCWIKSS
jgi:hypothetical protein